jgi:hypothetical protein
MPVLFERKDEAGLERAAGSDGRREGYELRGKVLGFWPGPPSPTT